LTGTPGVASERNPAKAAPKVAPKNSGGEKMPPDDPEPKLTPVATSLQTNNGVSSQAVLSCSVKIA
jgi:hypothetical protein